MPATPVHIQVLIPNTYCYPKIPVYARFHNNARALVYAQAIKAAILYARADTRAFRANVLSREQEFF